MMGGLSGMLIGGLACLIVMCVLMMGAMGFAMIRSGSTAEPRLMTPTSKSSSWVVCLRKHPGPAGRTAFPVGPFCCASG